MLQDKGLRKVGRFFVLGDEAGLKKKLRELEPLRRKVTDAQKKTAAADKTAEQKKQLIDQSLQQRHELEVALRTETNPLKQAGMINTINELGDRIEILEKSLTEDKTTKTLRAAATEITEQYVEAIMQIRKQCKALKAKYDALAADAQVKEAIDEVNKADPPAARLGPSVEFAAVDSNLKKLEGNVVTETISMHHDDGDTWTVSVTFNGQHSCELTIDTGSSSIALPYKTAGELGLTPSENDPTIVCVLADGHRVKCKRVYAKTVRVGKFTVEHVECGVMPADCPEAGALLGQSFLKHFTFRIDNANGKLIMAQVGQKGARGRGPKPAENAEEDKTAIPDTPESEKHGPAAMVKLLKLENERAADRMEYPDSDGKPLVFSRSNWETMENLRKLGGDPDEMYKIPMKSNDAGEKSAPWKMYVWGPLYVFADDTGHARYYALTKPLETDPGGEAGRRRAARRGSRAGKDSTPRKAEEAPEEARRSRRYERLRQIAWERHFTSSMSFA